jgi:hypothetical protein
MAVTEESLLFAVRNIARHGDTDVFPFPLENHWFHDAETEVAKLINSIDSAFDERLRSYPVHFVKSLSSVGYNGFRAATQIDPLWNAYLLRSSLKSVPNSNQNASAWNRTTYSPIAFALHPSATRYSTRTSAGPTSTGLHWSEHKTQSL